MTDTLRNKEQNYISAVTYVDHVGTDTIQFFRSLNTVMEEHFSKYEIIAVTTYSADHNDQELRNFANEIICLLHWCDVVKATA